MQIAICFFSVQCVVVCLTLSSYVSTSSGVFNSKYVSVAQPACERAVDNCVIIMHINSIPFYICGTLSSYEYVWNKLHQF